MTQLLAYPGGEAQKAAVIAELEDHAAHDRLVKGVYWEQGKGCAVGCAIQSGNHAEYEPRFGIPQPLAHLEDRMFEELPNQDAMKWPVQFMAAVPVGADLSRVQWQFLAFVVDEALSRPSTAPAVREACLPALEVVQALARGETVSESAARGAAESAARGAAESAAWSAARSAAESARSAAWSAAWSAAESAESAAESAAWSAAWSARSAAESAPWSAAWSAAWKRYAAKLLELIAAAPVPVPA